MVVVLVLGSSGLVGQAIKRIVSSLLPKRDDLRDVSVLFATRTICDCRDPGSVETLIRATRATHVINVAAHFGNIRYIASNPGSVLSDNARISLAVLEACRRCAVQRVVMVLSTYMFAATGDDFTEERALAGEPEPQVRPYAAAKRLALELSEAFASQHEMDIVSLIPCNLYGPGDHFDADRGHLVSGIMTRAAELAAAAATTDAPPTLTCWGSGKPRRQLLFADDLAEALLWAAVAPEARGVGRLIVAPPHDHSVADVAEAVRDVVFPTASVEWDTSRPDGHMRLFASPAKYLSLRSGATFTPLDEGLRRTFAWYQTSQSASEAADGEDAPPLRPAALLESLTGSRRFPLCDDRISETDRMAALTLLATDAKLSMGDRVRELEQRFATYIGAKHAVFVNSGSSANLLMAHALVVAAQFLDPAACSLPRLRPGDGVLVPAVCWSTSVAPLLQLGLRPVLVDVDFHSLQVSLVDLEAKAAQPGVRALMLVHVLGPSADMDALMEICRRKDLIVLEDACEVMGNDCRGKKLGTFGLMGAFSTYYSHHICSVEGGFVVTDSDDADSVLRSTRAHGWTREVDCSHLALCAPTDEIDPRFCFVMPGFNVRNTELAAAIALKQLERLPSFNEARVANMRCFRGALSLLSTSATRELELVRVPEEPEWNGAVAWLCLPLLVDESVDVTVLKRELDTMGVETRPVVTGNMARQPMMLSAAAHAGETPESLPGAEEVHQRGFYIGLHTTPWNVEEALDLAARVVAAAQRARK